MKLHIDLEKSKYQFWGNKIWIHQTHKGINHYNKFCAIQTSSLHSNWRRSLTTYYIGKGNQFPFARTEIVCSVPDLEFGRTENLLDVLTQYKILGFCGLILNRLKFYHIKTWDIMSKTKYQLVEIYWKTVCKIFKIQIDGIWSLSNLRDGYSA